jgi:hypothetical protein
MIDSGELHGFPSGLSPRAERHLRQRMRDDPRPEGVAIADYYDLTGSDNFGDAVGPTWSEVAQYLDWMEEET